MTAPVPLSDRRQQLEEALAATTMRLPLRQDSGYGEDVISADGVQFGVSGEPADAALIVAAVNLAPELIAKVRELDARIRAGLALADELDRKANNLISENRTQPCDSLHRKYATGHATALQGAADDLRTTLTAPLARQPTTDGEGHP